MLLLGPCLIASIGHAADSLEGTWAMESKTVSATHVVIVGDLRSVATTSSLVVIDVEGGQTVLHTQVCGVDVRGGPVRTRIPDAYRRATPGRSYPLEVVSSAEGLTFRGDPGINIVGFDPACAEVPVEVTDPCVVDWDGDGLPGATIHATIPLFPWVDVQVAQRNHVTLEGTLLPDGTIRGSVHHVEVVNHVLDASNRLFASSPKSAPVEGASSFRMVPLPAGATCVEVLTELAK